MTIAGTRAPRRDAAHNRAALLDAARSVLRHDPGASLDAIATAAGLSRRAFYGHFATRDDLLGELIDQGAARVTAAVASVADADPVLELALLGRVIWDDVEPVRVLTQAALRGPLRARIAPALAGLHGRVLTAVERAVARGTARTDVSAELVARLVEGAAFAVLDEANRAPIGRDEGRRLVILGGLGALGLSWRDADAVLADSARRLGLDEA
jgi:AcrR family transcriptional regulator